MLPPHLPVPQGAHGGAQRAKFDALAVFVLTGGTFHFRLFMSLSRFMTMLFALLFTGVWTLE